MINQTLKDRYKISDRIGKGAMGTVYRATDAQTGREVALKVISGDLSIDPEMQERFKREGEALRQLKHPNIVEFLDAFQHGEGYVIVMEYLPDGSLHELIAKGPLPIERANHIALELCDALVRSHHLNIIHRDLKPENILLTEDGTPKLADFGVARLSEGTRMTRSGTQVGTPYYMAPEAWEGKTLDAQADIWSLGIVLYEMLAGQVPFGGDTGAAVMNKVLTASPPDLRKLRADVPLGLVKIVTRMLTRDKKRRYPTMRQLSVDLESSQQMTAPRTLPTPVSVGSSSVFNGRNLLIGGVLFVGIILGVIFLLPRTGLTNPPSVSDPPTEAPAQSPTTDEAPASSPTLVVDAASSECDSADIFCVGLVTDIGGIDDKSFNATAYQGIKRAVTELGVDGKYLESQQQDDYAKNIQQFLDENSDLIVTVSFLLGVDTANAAKANPDVNFVIVDYAYPDCFSISEEGKTCGSSTELSNVLGLTFSTDQAAFLAGYAAAASTKTGKVATFGGLNIPPVVIFMKGFEAGVDYYNEKKNANVEVLGWSTAAGDGSFTGNFDSLDDGRAFAESFVQEGADIVFPVAGPVGLGSAAYCQETRSCMIIGVDTDWTVSASEYSDVILTSVLKKMDVAIFDAIKADIEGTFQGGVYVGTLENGGVGLAPVAGASNTLNTELDMIKMLITFGTVKVGE